MEAIACDNSLSSTGIFIRNSKGTSLEQKCEDFVLLFNLHLIFHQGLNFITDHLIWSFLPSFEDPGRKICICTNDRFRDWWKSLFTFYAMFIIRSWPQNVIEKQNVPTSIQFQSNKRDAIILNLVRKAFQHSVLLKQLSRYKIKKNLKKPKPKYI